MTWINRFLCFLSIVMYFSNFADSASYSKQPQENIIVRSGSSVWLTWMYQLGLIDSFILFRCGMYDTVKKDMIVILEKTSTTSPVSVRAAWKNQVTAYPLNTTFSVWNLDFENSGKYYCVLSFRTLLVPRVLPSKMTTLTVQGKPKFCQALPKTFEVDENQNTNIPVAVCSSPQPSLLFAAGPSSSLLPVHLTVDNVKSYRYSGRVGLSGMKRKACGIEVLLKLSNHLAAANDERITLTVKFRPIAPPGIEVKHQSDGKCIECTWGTQESGSCAISYTVEFMDKDEGVIVSSTTKSRHASTCRTGIRKVKITATFTGLSASSSMTLDGTGETSNPNSSGSLVAIGGGAGGGVLLLIVIIVVVFIIRRRVNSDNAENNRQEVEANKRPSAEVAFKPDKNGQGNVYVVGRPTENGKNEYQMDDPNYEYLKAVPKRP